jgi:glycosyltransferase involved in cell wall biosynthesis
MKQLVARHSLQRQVRFLGSREDVPRLIGLADALVAYSSVEGIPRVVMEAMFAGRPVIVSNTAGMEEVVSEDVGRLIDFDGAENSVALILQDLTDHPDRWQEMGKRARARATTLYSTKAMSEAIQAIYTELLGSRVNAQAKL